MHPAAAPPLPPSLTALPRALEGIRILSLALNLPGPAALMRCQHMGAQCLKLEPPGGDPMQHYSPAAYAQLHQGIEILQADLKSQAGQAQLHARLAQADVLITSFRPAALDKLGLGWAGLQQRHAHLSQVAIVGSPGAGADQPGHDLTYLAGEGLVCDLTLPATLYADMAGSLMVSEAVLQAVLMRSRHKEPMTAGVRLEVALSDAAGYAALPRRWGLSTPDGAVGGAHAGYAVYACRDGRVAVAALEPHFAAALAQLAGLSAPGLQTLLKPEAHARLAAFFAERSRQEIDALAAAHDIPLRTMA